MQAIERDASQANLEAYCSFSDSYGVGKGIGMHARLASISRAFGTSHYQALDGKIRHCLEKWLRIDGKISLHFKTISSFKCYPENQFSLKYHFCFLPFMFLVVYRLYVFSMTSIPFRDCNIARFNFPWFL